MPSNEEAADQLRAIADLLDVLGERFKPEAYRRAARSIEGLGEDLAALEQQGELDEVPGVGAAISEKLREYLRDGRIGYLERLRSEVPNGLAELLKVPGLGPKTVRRFWTELGITGPPEALAAIEAGRLAGVKGFGPTKIEALRAALQARPGGDRIDLWTATQVADGLVADLRAAARIDRVEVAGSYRRARETVGDLDLLVLTPEPERVFDAFGNLPVVETVRLRGPTKETVQLRSGLQVDLRIVPAASYGAALQYFTGSKDHNVRLRTRARDLGLKVNEYGVYRGETPVAGATEASVYEALGLVEIPPELREDHGEIEAAEERKLPALVAPGQIRGELHVHPPAGAGPEMIGPLRASATAAGHAYVGVVLPTSTSAADAAGWKAAAAKEPKSPSVWIGAEGGDTDGPAWADYVLRDARAGAPPSTPGPARWALVHLPLAAPGRLDSDPGRLAPWLPWIRATGAALELGPLGARTGLDSTTARAVVEAGGKVLIGSGLDGSTDGRRLEVAVAFARRAVLGPDAILNTRDDPRSEVRSPRSSPARRRSRTDP